jgi:ubiquinone/menaquinone biosynthesis C-methylase UbiE
MLRLGAVVAGGAAAISTLGPQRLCARLRAICQSEEERESDRERWQKVPQVLEALNVREGGRVADVGAGSGFFTVRLARAVGPSGRVFAVDVNAGTVRDLKARVQKEELSNVEVIEGAPDDPRLPHGSLDAALIVNAYHEMDRHDEMLQHIYEALRPGGRLVIIEPISDHRQDDTREQQKSSHEIAAGYVEQDLRAAGFEILERHDAFAERPDDDDSEWMIVAAKRNERS